jgi:hypothetical protein
MAYFLPNDLQNISKFRIMNIISFTFLVLVSLSKMLNLEEYPGTQLFLFLFSAFPQISALL